MRLMSFAATIPQILDGSKTVTRRLGWLDVVPGERFLAVERSRGVRREDRRELGVKEVVHASRVPLWPITRDEVAREGFPGMEPHEFTRLFRRLNGLPVGWNEDVTRIEFRPVEDAA